MHKHVVLQLKDHDKYSQKPSDKTVRIAPKSLLLSTAFFHLSIIERRQCCDKTI